MKLSFKNVIILLLLGTIFIFLINPIMGPRANSNSPEIIEEAIFLYRESSGYTGSLTGEVRNFGCHSEIWIYNNSDELVGKYSQWGNRLQPTR